LGKLTTYTSQDKGTVENRIGLIMAFLPKKTDLNKIYNQTIAEIKNKINKLPQPLRKIINLQGCCISHLNMAEFLQLENAFINKN
jgi:IS30 family transposase